VAPPRTGSEEPNAPRRDREYDALRLEDVSPGARLVIRTETAVYQITVIAPALRQIVVCGGPHFPRPVGVHLDGCSSDGRFLEVGAIGIGCSLELRTRNGVVVTGPVRSIGFVHHA
jgi:hypothetical protein